MIDDTKKTFCSRLAAQVMTRTVFSGVFFFVVVERTENKKNVSDLL